MENSMHGLLRKNQMGQGGYRLLTSGDTPGKPERGGFSIDKGSLAIADSTKWQSLYKKFSN